MCPTLAHKKERRASAMMRRTAHGGTLDRGPTSSDRGAADQLNAQSLDQARAGGGAGVVR